MMASPGLGLGKPDSPGRRRRSASRADSMATELSDFDPAPGSPYVWVRPCLGIQWSID